MLATLFGTVQNTSGPPLGFFAGFFALWGVLMVVWLGSLAFMIVCIVDIARRPEWQWRLANSEKLLWLLLVILVNFLAIPSFIYWFSVRPKLQAVDDAARAGRLGPGLVTPVGWVPAPMPVYGPPPGWYPDPQGASQLRFWDGVGWTEGTAPAAAPGAGPA